VTDPRRELMPPLDEATSSIPGLVRIAAISSLHAAEWGTAASVKAGRRLLSAVVHPHEAVGIAQDLARSTVVVADIAKAMSAGIPLPQAVAEVGRSLGPSLASIDLPSVPAVIGNQANALRTSARAGSSSSAPRQLTPTELLRLQGQELLQRSRDVWNNDTAHPAYERILADLAPDEARILVLMLRGGPQPSVDVRTGGPIGLLNSRLLAPGITMIGPRAGCRYLDQVPSYLNNLNRLGLIWFSREQLHDPLDYQVVEAQPEVLKVMHSVRFTKVVRRSIHLTPFGEDFCRMCLAPDVDPAKLPHHANPDDRHGPLAQP
jgi:hypothetical protein